jgi:transposase
MVEVLERRIHEIELSLRRLARHQPGCQALMTQYGVGELVALTRLTELGALTRVTSSRKAVRFAGPDIGVHRSAKTARVGKLTRQRSSPWRWAPPRTTPPASNAPTTATTRPRATAGSPTPARP